MRGVLSEFDRKAIMVHLAVRSLLQREKVSIEEIQVGITTVEALLKENDSIVKDPRLGEISLHEDLKMLQGLLKAKK